MATLLSFPDLQGRPIEPGDAEALADFEADCRATDSGYNATGFAEAITTTCMVESATERIAAIGWVTIQKGAQDMRAILGGAVRPEFRGLGIGRVLLLWLEATALEYRPESPLPFVARIDSTCLSPSADALYRSWGYTYGFSEIVMRRDLTTPFPNTPPAGVTLVPWTDALIERFYRMYQQSFVTRPGFPNWTFDEWNPLLNDPQHLAEYSFLAVTNGQDVGFINGEIIERDAVLTGWIDELGVIPAARGRGLAGYLLSEAMRRFAKDGICSTILHVNADNPEGQRAYAKIGFVEEQRRTVYTKRQHLAVAVQR